VPTSATLAALTLQDSFANVFGAHRGRQPLGEIAAAGTLVRDSRVARDQIEDAKIPLSELWPDRAHYVATLHESSLCPTRAELTLLRDYVECVTNSFYHKGLAARMLAAPYAGDDGHNTSTFTKRGVNDWAYRHYTWEHGPWPFMGGPVGPLSLLALLDHIEKWGDSLSTRWQAWHDAHPALCVQP
jgi:hypothetical protein